MAEQTDEIQQHIQSKRAELGHNLEELETKVKSAADWHTYFERYPMAALGLSVGGGMVLAMLAGSRSRRGGARMASTLGAGPEGQPMPAATNYSRRTSGDTRGKVSETMDTLKGALLGLATSKVRDMLSDAMPGFREQYDRAERQRDRIATNGQPPMTM